MIRRAVGAMIGAEIERNRGQSGVKGALLGAVAFGVLRRMGPLGTVLGGAYVAKQMLDRHRAARRAL